MVQFWGPSRHHLGFKTNPIYSFIFAYPVFVLLLNLIELSMVLLLQLRDANANQLMPACFLLSRSNEGRILP